MRAIDANMLFARAILNDTELGLDRLRMIVRKNVR
jgi:hypothetical protein